MKKVKDLKDRPLLLFVNEWSIRMTQERNDGLVLTEFARSNGLDKYLTGEPLQMYANVVKCLKRTYRKTERIGRYE